MFFKRKEKETEKKKEKVKEKVVVKKKRIRSFIWNNKYKLLFIFIFCIIFFLLIFSGEDLLSSLFMAGFCLLIVFLILKTLGWVKKNLGKTLAYVGAYIGLFFIGFGSITFFESMGMDFYSAGTEQFLVLCNTNIAQAFGMSFAYALTPIFLVLFAYIVIKTIF